MYEQDRVIIAFGKHLKPSLRTAMILSREASNCYQFIRVFSDSDLWSFNMLIPKNIIDSDSRESNMFNCAEEKLQHVIISIGI